MTVQSGNGVWLAHLLNPALTPCWQRKDLHPPLRQLLKQHKNRRQTLLISSEIFSDSDSKRFAILRELLEAKEYEVTVLACIREIRGWIFSTYQQGVKRAALSETFNEFAHSKLSQYTYATVTRLRQMGDQLRVFPYKPGDVFRPFLEAIGEDPDLADAVPRKTVNRSLSREELTLLQQVNAVFGSKSLSEKISDSFLYKTPALVSAKPSESELETIEALIPKARARLGEAESKPLEDAIRLLFSDPDVDRHGEGHSAQQPSENLALLQVLEHLKEASEEWILIREFVQTLTREKGPFDPVHYALMYPRVLARSRDPQAHYDRNGKKEGHMGRLRRP